MVYTGEGGARCEAKLPQGAQPNKIIFKQVQLAIIYRTANREYFVSRAVIKFSDKQPCTALSRIYFCMFNCRTSQGVRKYFNDEMFVIYGTSFKAGHLSQEGDESEFNFYFLYS